MAGPRSLALAFIILIISSFIQQVASYYAFLSQTPCHSLFKINYSRATQSPTSQTLDPPSDVTSSRRGRRTFMQILEKRVGRRIIWWESYFAAAGMEQPGRVGAYQGIGEPRRFI